MKKIKARSYTLHINAKRAIDGGNIPKFCHEFVHIMF